MVPFSLSRPSRSSSVIAPSEALTPQRNREQVFFQQRGIDLSPARFKLADSSSTCPYSTVTVSDGQTVDEASDSRLDD